MAADLAALIEEQEKDMRHGWRVHSISAERFIDWVIPGDGLVGYLIKDPHRNPRYTGAREPERRQFTFQERLDHSHKEPVKGLCMAYVNLGPTWSGSTRCSRRAAVGEFCRGHAGQNGILLLRIPRGTTLCACGCGDPVNPIYDYAVARVSEGWTHQRIANEVQTERTYIGALLRKPPRFIKGHSARVYWRAKKA